MKMEMEMEMEMEMKTNKTTTDKKTFWRKYEPSVPIPVLYLLSGAMWIYVGQMLISYAIDWFKEKNSSFLWFFILLSIIGALSIYKFGFSKIVYKNINRLQQKNREKICIFAFIEWKSYFIMLFMIGMGISIRTIVGSNLYLGVMYNSIGGGLLLSGLIYFNPKLYKKIIESKIKT